MPTPRKHANPAQRQAAYRARLREVRAQELADRGLPPLPAIPSIPGQRRWNALIRRVLRVLETLAVEMQSYYDDRSDAWRDSDRGETHLERLEAVEAAVSAAEELQK